MPLDWVGIVVRKQHPIAAWIAVTTTAANPGRGDRARGQAIESSLKTLS